MERGQNPEFVLMRDEAVEALWKELGAFYNPVLWEAIPNYRAYIEKIKLNALTYGFYLNRSLAGGVSFYANDTDTRIAYISQLAVHGAYRGRGLGKTIVECVCGLAREKGMNTIRLEVLRKNMAARMLYEKTGFEYEDIQDENSLFMMKTLSDDVFS